MNDVPTAPPPAVEAAAPEVPALRTGPTKVPLRKKVEAWGKMVDEIVFREPTAEDVVECGAFPCRLRWVGDGVYVDVDPKAMRAMMSRLAQVPPMTISMMHPADFMTASLSLQSFFLPDLG